LAEQLVAKQTNRIDVPKDLSLLVPTAIGLSLAFAGLTFAHIGARDSANVLKYLPRVGNLARNVVVRSEVPLGGTGVQGHAIFTGRALFTGRVSKATRLMSIK